MRLGLVPERVDLDPVAILGGSAGLGGLVVSLYSITRTRRTDKETLGVKQIEVALDAQQRQLDRQDHRMKTQDAKIAEQAAKIETQACEIRELQGKVDECDREKNRLSRELELMRRSM